MSGNPNERRLRRGQSISPFGVGAVYDRLGESFVAEDTSRWQGTAQRIDAPRIAALFGREELRTPPTAEEGPGSLPFFRFPQWLFCGSCRRMTQWSIHREKRDKPPRCGLCTSNAQLVPMRFVLVCGHGHLGDVDWRFWAHSGPANRGRERRQCGRSELTFGSVRGVGGGLNSVEVRCGCGAHRDLKDLPGPDAMKNLKVRCSGRQPWQTSAEAAECGEWPVALQRGAASVYYALVGSALDIPPDSDWSSFGDLVALVRNHQNFKWLEGAIGHPLAGQMVAEIARDVEVSRDLVVRLLEERVGETPAVTAAAEDADGYRAREYEALTNPVDTHHPLDRFQSRAAPFPSADGHGQLDGVARAMAGLLTRVVLVDRLREIRVLTGFRRHTEQALVAPDLGRRDPFLPALEVYGEGYFLQFREDALARWETAPEVVQRAARLRGRLAASNVGRWLQVPVTPRLILLHTAAHLLMRQTAFDAGYSASSLRERIFADDGQAGVLVYTAASDSEGTMGGLARLGEAARLLPIVSAALANADWCSLDPVCRESSAQGTDGLSLAACHACALASETSCTHGNVLLDRMLLLDPGYGFFREVAGAVIDAQGQIGGPG